MTQRQLTWAAAVLLLAVTVVTLRSCGGGDRAASAPVDADATASAAAGAGGSESAADAATEAARRDRVQKREAALVDAASAVQRYLGALGAGDMARADAMWSHGRPPASTGEATLRTLDGLFALRIENDAPVALDREAVPESVEVPVSLRATLQAGGSQRYQGWYRLRRRAVDGQWEITGAALTALPAAPAAR